MISQGDRDKINKVNILYFGKKKKKNWRSRWRFKHVEIIREIKFNEHDLMEIPCCLHKAISRHHFLNIESMELSINIKYTITTGTSRYNFLTYKKKMLST